MTTETLSLGELTAADEAAWKELAVNAVEPNPFYEPEFVLPACRHLRPHGLRLLVVRQGSAWFACLPVRTVLTSPVVLVGLEHRYSFLSTPLIRRDAVAEGATGLLAPNRRGRARLVALRHAGSEGPADDALRAAADGLGLTRAWERRSSRAVARPLATGSRSRRRSLQRMRRRLEAEVQASLTIDDRAGSDQAIEEFLRLEAAGWKGRAGTALACNQRDRAFFTAMAAGFAARGRLWLSTLSAGDRILAMSCDLLAGHAMFGFKSCHDEAFRRFAPGIQLFDEILERFHGDGELSLYDSCSDPDATVMNELFGGRREISTFLAVPRQGAWLARHAIDGALALRARSRRGSSRAEP